MPRSEGEPVTLDKFDTLHSFLAKLDRSDRGWPYVVIASDCRIADNVLIYKLIARASEQFASPISVVARNPRWRHLAREHGLRAYGSLGSLRRARRRSVLRLFDSLADLLLSSLHLSLSRQGLVIVAAVVLLMGMAAWTFVPVMNVTIRTPVETLNREVMVRVDVSAARMDVPSTTIPARIIEHRFMASDFVETTGEKTVGKERARGEVTIINSSPGLVVLPAGTILSTGSGVRFRTAAAVTVGPFAQPVGTTPVPSAGSAPVVGPTGQPARPTASATAGPTAGPASTPAVPAPSGVIARVQVEAVDPGGKGNTPALAISKVEGDAFRGLTVFNEQPVGGGTDTKVKSASGEDRSRLKEALFQRAQSQALSELTLRVRQSESLIPHSLRVQIDQEEFDKAPDEEANRLTGKFYVAAAGIAFANQDLNTLVERDWKESMPAGYRALSGALNVAPPEVVEAGARTASLRVKVAGRVERVLEIDRLAESLRGISVHEARARLAHLERPLRLERVEIWPEWAPRAYRIEVLTVQ